MSTSIAEVVSRAEPQETGVLDEETLDPNLHYRWTTNNPNQISRRISQGYRLVSRKTDGVKTLIEDQKQPDDRIYNGDLVLMCCDARSRAKRRQDKIELADKWLSAPADEFKTRHSQSGVRNSRVLYDEEGD